MEFIEEKYVAGKTVLIDKATKDKYLYLGSAGLVHFISEDNMFDKACSMNYTTQQLEEMFTIEGTGLDVPLERRVYDFVPVLVRDSDEGEWKERKLIVVIPNAEYPYITNYQSKKGETFAIYKQAKFL